MQPLIDKSDKELCSKYNWYVHPSGYIWGRPKGTNESLIYLHRLLMDFPKGMTVDHINRNKSDNRRSNLRIITHAQNCLNQKGGAYFSHYSKTKGNRWVAKVARNYLGIYSSEEEAQKVADKFRKELICTSASFALSAD